MTGPIERRTQLVAPFPWAGGKRRVAVDVWARFGEVGRFVEPFAGGAAVLLGRPDPKGHEVLGDADGDVVNFWRSIKADPDGVADAMDWPVLEADLVARNAWLAGRREQMQQLLADPLWFDARAAGWWAWVQSNAMGHKAGHTSTRPTTGGRGVGGRRIRQAEDPGARLRAICEALAHRLRAVTVFHGDFTRTLTHGALFTHLKAKTPVGVFLDPPYAHDVMTSGRALYVHHDTDISAKARAWAIEHGQNPRLRVALCGYEGEHQMPPDWEVFAWSSPGFAFNAARREKGMSERIWFSPSCLRPEGILPKPMAQGKDGDVQLALFAGGLA